MDTLLRLPATTVRVATPCSITYSRTDSSLAIHWVTMATAYRKEDGATEKLKPAPKKLNINWSARTQERAAERADNEPVGTTMFVRCNLFSLYISPINSFFAGFSNIFLMD